MGASYIDVKSDMAMDARGVDAPDLDVEIWTESRTMVTLLW